MHGPEEVAACRRVVRESGGGARAGAKYLENRDYGRRERRTTVNLGECIRVARERVIFINTGVSRQDWR